MLNERDIFFSNNPANLLSPYSNYQLAIAFDYPVGSIYDLIDHINSKYNRVDFISLDPKGCFFDYNTQRILPLNKLNINNYSPMALQNLKFQLESSNNPFPELLQKINDELYKIFNANAIIDNGEQDY
jgi:hypothetical protein